MNVREFTFSVFNGTCRRCDGDRISRSFPPLLEKATGFAPFAVENLR
ncbi:hypothetical protein A8O28_12000 [Enterobacteriaceae bacterium CCUG 67584]|nr:hypothetical protein [Enterobacteriaceae bacterium CCUG 67584]